MNTNHGAAVKSTAAQIFTAKLVLATLAIAALHANPAVAQTPPGEAHWQHDPATPGDWFDAANWLGGLPGEPTHAAIDNGGTAVIGGGHAVASALNLGTAEGRSGTLRVTGGLTEFLWTILGTWSGANGNLEMHGGKLATYSLVLGRGGGGEVDQSGGEIDGTTCRLATTGTVSPAPSIQACRRTSVAETIA